MRTSVVALLVVLVAVIAGCSGGEGQTTSTMAGPPTSIVVASTIPTTTTTTEPPFVLAGDEIYLEAAGSAGPEAFTGEVFLPSGPPSTLNIPTTTVGAGSPSATSEPEPPATSGGASSTQVASYRGDTPALYGGSKDKRQADKEGQLAFFDQNPQEAAAFCTALNSDPAFA